MSSGATDPTLHHDIRNSWCLESDSDLTHKHPLIKYKQNYAVELRIIS